MGYEVVYCFKCQVRLTHADFEKGKALRKWNNTICATCARTMAITDIACFWCKKELKASDVDRGLASRIDDQYVCAKCEADLPGKASSKETAPVAARAAPSRRVERRKPRGARPKTPTGSDGKLTLILGISAGGLFAVILFLAISGGDSGEHAAPVAKPSSVKPVAQPTENP